MQYAIPQNQAVDLTPGIISKKILQPFCLKTKDLDQNFQESKMSAILPRILTHGKNSNKLFFGEKERERKQPPGIISGQKVLCADAVQVPFCKCDEILSDTQELRYRTTVDFVYRYVVIYMITSSG